jgi:long-subunit fatty acid transport protein
MRAAHEQRAATEAGQFLSNGSDVLLSFGLTWTLGDRFNAGAGLNYRVLQSQTPASAQSTPPATFSVSAGGKF